MNGWTTLAATLSIVASAFGLAPHAAAAPEPSSHAVEPIFYQAWGTNATFRIPMDLTVADAATGVRVRAFTLDPSGAAVPVDATVWTVSLTPLSPGAGAPPAPAPAPGPRDDAPRPAPQPTAWAAPRELIATERPLGLFRALRDLLAVLLELLRSVGLLGALLYHRIAPSRALDHPLRARLLAELTATPGVHASALAEAVGAHAKTVTYHLRVLERTGSLRLERDGRMMRAWPSAAPSTEAPDASETRVRALELLRARLADDRDGLAALLGVTPQAMSYHLKILRRDGRVRVRWVGRRREYQPV